MKWILLLCLIFAFDAYSACTSATRTNFTTNQVLTSSRLNSELNNLVSTVNAFDGGCINSGSVEAASLNSTEFAPLLKGVVQGCELSYVDSNTVGVSKCKIAVDGNLFETTSQNNVTWGCSGCASEATGSSFYVYVKDAASFTLSLSTTAPGKDGYNGTDKAVGGFYNNSSSNIATSSVMSFLQSDIAPAARNIPKAGENTLIATAYATNTALVSETGGAFASCNSASAQVCTFHTGAWGGSSPYCTVTVANNNGDVCSAISSTTSVETYCKNDAGSTVNPNKYIICIGPKLGP